MPKLDATGSRCRSEKTGRWVPCSECGEGCPVDAKRRARKPRRYLR